MIKKVLKIHTEYLSDKYTYFTNTRILFESFSNTFQTPSKIELQFIIFIFSKML